MGSITYEVSQKCDNIISFEADIADRARSEIRMLEKKKMTIPKELRNKARETTPQSWRGYKHHAITFAKWCKVTFGCRHMDDCRPYIQTYVNYLHDSGKTAATIHTYLAGICRVYEIPMDYIEKPRRSTADNTRSRGIKATDNRNDSKRDASPRLYDLACMVGCRRAEYARLRGNDLVYDESGYLCVRIRKGKGGKYQEQRIAPEHELFVRGYFDGSEDYVFSKDELRNKIDLHHIRAKVAQHQYDYYRQRLDEEPGYRAQLETELKKRRNRLCKGKKWRACDLSGYYYVRGRNRELALKNGRPIRYDSLAVLAVSVFHLSHWRNDVTVANYLLAV